MLTDQKVSSHCLREWELNPHSKISHFVSDNFKLFLEIERVGNSYFKEE